MLFSPLNTFCVFQNLTRTVPASTQENHNSPPVLSPTLSTSQSQPSSKSWLEPQSQAQSLTYSSPQIQLQASAQSQAQSYRDASLTKSSPAVAGQPATSIANAYIHNQQQNKVQQQRQYSLQWRQQKQLREQQKQSLRLLLQQKQIPNQLQPQPQQRQELQQQSQIQPQSWQGQQNQPRLVQQTEQQLQQKVQLHHQQQQQQQVQQKQLSQQLHHHQLMHQRLKQQQQMKQQRQIQQQQQMQQQQRLQNPLQAGRIGEFHPQQSQVYTVQQQQQIQATNVMPRMALQQNNSPRTVVPPSHTLQQPIRQQVRFGQHRMVQQAVKQPAQQMGAARSVQQSVTQQIQVGASASLAKPVEHAIPTVQQPVTQQIRLGVPLSLQQPVLSPSQPVAASGLDSSPNQSGERQVVVIPDSPPDVQQQSFNPTQTEEHNKDGLFHHWKITTPRRSQHFDSQLPRSSTQDKNHLVNQENLSSTKQLSAQKYQIQPSSQALTQTVSSYYHQNAARSLQSNSSFVASNSHLINTSATQQPTVVTARPTSQQSTAHFQTVQVQPSSGTIPSSMPEQQRGSSGRNAQNTNFAQATAPVKSSGLPSSTMPTNVSNNHTQNSFHKQNVDQDPDIIITNVVSQKGTENAKEPPGKPSVSISVTENGIVLSWTMELKENGSAIGNYELFTLQDDLREVSSSSSLPWKKIGKVEAMPLPMACTLTQFLVGNNYHFAVRAVDVNGRAGPFSDACTAILTNTEPDQ